MSNSESNNPIRDDDAFSRFSEAIRKMFPNEAIIPDSWEPLAVTNPGAIIGHIDSTTLEDGGLVIKGRLDDAGADFLNERRTVSETGGEKGVKVERYDLIPVRPLESLARRYGYGAEKYAERNWERGYEYSKSYAAAQRHLNAFWRGEDEDDEMPGGHLAAAAFHIFALMEFGVTHPEFDDRPKEN